MGDASKGRRRLIVAVVMAAVLAGVGAAAQAGLLSRAESSTGDGGGSSRAAGAAIADPSGNGSDIVAVSETTATHDGTAGHSSATALRIGETKVGEAPIDESNPLVDALPGEAEMITDVGCDDSPDNLTQSCVAVLHSIREEGPSFGYAEMRGAEFYTPLTGYNVLLSSNSGQDTCFGGSEGYVADGDLLEEIDLSGASSSNCG